jgi:hypothetical protein
MAYTANSLASRFLSRTYIFNPADATVATKVAYVAMGQKFLAKATLVSGTGVLTFKVFAATDGSGTGTTVVAAHAAPTAADAAGDQLVLEIDNAQVLAALAGATHVSVEIDCDHADDIVAIEYLMEPVRQFNAMTADVIS